MKSKLKIIFSLTMMFAVIFANIAFATEYEGLEYKIENNEVTIVSGYGINTENLVIPATIEDLPVVEIAEQAFLELSIESVELPESLRTIGDYAFIATPLVNVTIPKNVTSIGKAAFGSDYMDTFMNIKVDSENPAYCDIDGVLFTKNKENLLIYPDGRKDSTYTIPTGTKVIGENSLSASEFTKVVIPNTVTSIKNQAFHGSQSLVDVTIPSSVVEFGNEVFGSKSFPASPDLTLKVEQNSAAEQYAKDNNIKYEYYVPTQETVETNTEAVNTPVVTEEVTQVTTEEPVVATTTETVAAAPVQVAQNNNKTTVKQTKKKVLDNQPKTGTESVVFLVLMFSIVGMIISKKNSK